ncbi:DUF5133 domain-containing protein [Streptomyces sp. NPDC047000]|uniref:DUF5133 domain-containing protein n=1 Tax=Streptomyces sp. NPDC047000 TaxID=3155474 RepID=UPI0033D54019
MLMPHPEFLRKLVAEYEALQAGGGAEPGGTTAERAARLRDLAYTLCVSTGTRDVAGALETARLRLAAAAAV